MQKVSNTLKLYSSEKEVSNLLLKLQADKKRYAALLSMLEQLGAFDESVEVYFYDSKDNNWLSYTRIWFFDKEDNIFIIYADSNKKTDLTIIEKQSNSKIEKYDASLAKNFPINSDNLDYLKSDKEYSFKFGKLVTDNQTFYSLFLGGNIGFQIQINYSDERQTVNIEELLEQLNQLNSKPNMNIFLNLFHVLLEKSKITFQQIRILAYKDFNKLADFVIDNDTPNQGTVISAAVEMPEQQVATPKPVVASQPVITSKPTVSTSEKKEVPKSKPKKKKKVKEEEMTEEKKYLMTQEHYNDILAEIDELNKERDKVNSGRGEAFAAGAGDGWDSPEFEEIERQEGLIMGQIAHRKEMLANSVIIEKQDNEDLIDIDDIVKLSVKSDSITDENWYKLTGGSEIGHIDGIICVSVNSPIGASIYHQKVGASVSYQVKDRYGSQPRIFYVDIIEKVKDAPNKNIQL